MFAQPPASFVMAKAYRANFVCPHMDFSKWEVIEDSIHSLTEISRMQFTFNCPTHGPQQEMPIQVQEKTDWSAKKMVCSIDECVEDPIETVSHRSYCRDHFILVCRGQLEVYNQKVKEQNWRELSFGVLEQFIMDCMRGADRIEHGNGGLDDFQRAQLLNIILSAAELGRHLRRSSRKDMVLLLRLVSEKPQESWEEDTETITVSRFGALVRSRHPVVVGACEKVA